MSLSPRTERATLNSLALELGVSRQTVSNVINHPHVVRPETRERVQAAIKRSGYRPSAAGRALRSQRSLTLAMRLSSSSDGLAGTVLDRFLHRLTLEARRAGYRVTLIAADSAADEVAMLDELWQISSIDGAVITDTDVDDPRPAALTAAGIPFVAFGRPWGTSSAGHFWVDVDGSAGTEQATRHLRLRGHTRIGFLGWPRGSGCGDDRRFGWQRAMADLPEDEALHAEVEDDPRAGAAAGRRLIAQGATALVCASDSLALGAAGVFRSDPPPPPRPTSGGGRAPAPAPVREDAMPVIGFDDTRVAQAVGLSSVRQPIEAAAVRTVELLMARLNETEPPRPQSLLTPRLIVRPLEHFSR